MSTGKANPLPFESGSGPSSTESAYAALRSAVGPGMQGPPDGLRELWWQCVAEAVARAAQGKDLAAMQAFPPAMTVHLTPWERFLALPREHTDVERREAVWRAITYQPDATGPTLGAQLRAIDAAFIVDSPLLWEQSATVVHGKAFGPLPGDSGVLFGQGQAAGRRAAEFCNFSDAFVIRVRYTLPSGVTEIPLESERKAIALLCDSLPFWCDFEVYNLTSGPDGEGFYTDGGLDGTSLTDQTGL